MAHGDDPDHDLYDDEYDPYDEDPYDEPTGGTPDEELDDGGWGADPPARQGALRLLVGVAALLLALGVAAAISKAGDDDPDTDEVATDERSTSSSRRTTTSRPLALPGEPRPTVTTSAASSTSTTTRGTSTTRQPAGTTTSVPDSDAPEPACASAGGGPAVPPPSDWARRWQTMPRPNDPVTLSICVDDVTPAVGQIVRLSLRADDPDAEITQQECGYVVLWEAPYALPQCRDWVIEPAGPRPTPNEEAGHLLVQMANTYTTAGVKVIRATVTSAEYHGYHSPYSSGATATLQLDVHA